MKMPRLRSERRYRFDYQAFFIVGGLLYFVTRKVFSWETATSAVTAISLALLMGVEDLRRRP
jgi:hypothetical protein